MVSPTPKSGAWDCAQHRLPVCRRRTFDEAELALKQDQSAATQRISVLGPKHAREDLLTRSGLLTDRGQKQVGVYHLSIQEFLCAERIFELRLDALKDVFLHYSRNATWRNTLSFLFARYMAAFSVATRPLALLRDLIDAADAESSGFHWCSPTASRC